MKLVNETLLSYSLVHIFICFILSPASSSCSFLFLLFLPFPPFTLDSPLLRILGDCLVCLCTTCLWMLIVPITCDHLATLTTSNKTSSYEDSDSEILRGKKKSRSMNLSWNGTLLQFLDQTHATRIFSREVPDVTFPSLYVAYILQLWSCVRTLYFSAFKNLQVCTAWF